MMLWGSDLSWAEQTVDQVTEWMDLDYPANKYTFNQASVPVIEFPDGKNYRPDVAIGRYIAQLTGYYPEDPILALKADSVAETVNTFPEKILGFMLGNPNGTPEEFAAGLKEVEEKVMPEFFAFLEPELLTCECDEPDCECVCGVCSCEELCLADFYFAGNYVNWHNNPMSIFNTIDPGFNERILENYPKFAKYGEWFEEKMA